MALVKNDSAAAARHFEEKMTFTTGPVELERELQSGTVRVIDVRASEDFVKGHVPGSINLPQDRWESLEGLEKDKLNVVLCYSAVCHLGAKAALVFANNGYSVMEMDGGFQGWKDNQLPIETGPGASEAA